MSKDISKKAIQIAGKSDKNITTTLKSPIGRVG